MSASVKAAVWALKKFQLPPGESKEYLLLQEAKNVIENATPDEEEHVEKVTATAMVIAISNRLDDPKCGWFEKRALIAIAKQFLPAAGLTDDFFNQQPPK